MDDLIVDLSKFKFTRSGEISTTDNGLLQAYKDADPGTFAASTNKCTNYALCNANGKCSKSLITDDELTLTDNDELIIRNIDFSKTIMGEKFEDLENLNIGFQVLNMK